MGQFSDDGQWWWELGPLVGLNLAPVNRRGFPEYRTWTIRQLALATTYVLGPDEPIVAGEVHMAWLDAKPRGCRHGRLENRLRVEPVSPESLN